MEPENYGLSKSGLSFSWGPFSGSLLVFRGVARFLPSRVCLNSASISMKIPSSHRGFVGDVTDIHWTPSLQSNYIYDIDKNT